MEQYTHSFKKKVAVVLWAVFAGVVTYNAQAADTTITQVQLGSGVPSGEKLTNAPLVMDGMYHAPQYLPGHPTAATIWPRVVDVECTKTEDLSNANDKGDNLVCDSYNWAPSMGRGEYIYIRPRLKNEPVPPAPVTPIVIYKEVPVKKGLE